MPGQIGGAVSFNSSDDLIQTAATIVENQYTFAFWLNVTGEGGFNPRIIGDGQQDWIIYSQFANQGIGFGGSSPKDPEEPLLNTWEHYAATYDRTTGAATVYRNGVQVATGTFQQPPRGTRWVFGHHSDLNIHVDSLHGKLDDLRIYDVILSAEEIRTLAGFPVSSPDSYAIREDGTLTVAGPGVLTNDNHGLDLPITAVQDSPAHGTLALSATGGLHVYSRGELQRAGQLCVSCDRWDAERSRDDGFADRDAGE